LHRLEIEYQNEKSVKLWVGNWIWQGQNRTKSEVKNPNIGRFESLWTKLNFGKIPSSKNPNFFAVNLDDTLSGSCSKCTVWNRFYLLL